jgi:hypothetical protein
MLFGIGKLYLEPGEPLYIGDPCYIPHSLDLMVRYNQPWVPELDIFDDNWVNPKTTIARVHKDKWIKEGSLKFRYMAVYVDMVPDLFFGGNPRNSAFILWSNLDVFPDIDKCKKIHKGYASVDSGVMSFIPAGHLINWIHPEDDPNPRSLHRDTNDFEATSEVALNNQLYAGAALRHTKFIGNHQSESVVATVFTSRTNYGDGTYGVYELTVEIDGDDVPMGLLVDFIGKYSDDDDDYAQAIRILTGQELEDENEEDEINE